MPMGNGEGWARADDVRKEAYMSPFVIAWPCGGLAKESLADLHAYISQHAKGCLLCRGTRRCMARRFATPYQPYLAEDSQSDSCPVVQ